MGSIEIMNIKGMYKNLKKYLFSLKALKPNASIVTGISKIQ